MDLTRHQIPRPTPVDDGMTLRLATTELLTARAAGKTNIARRQHAAIVGGLTQLPPHHRDLSFGVTLGQLERLGNEGIAIAQHVLTEQTLAGHRDGILFWRSMRDGLIETARDLSDVAAAAA